MATKLTLSVPAATVQKAKHFAKLHGTTVSALFTKAIDTLPDETRALDQAIGEWPELRGFIGLIGKPEGFDARSKRILAKHG